MSGDVLPAGSRMAPEVGDELRALADETRAALEAVPAGWSRIESALRQCLYLTDAYLRQGSVSTREAGQLVTLLETAIEVARERDALQLVALIDAPRGRSTLLRFGRLELRAIF